MTDDLLKLVNRKMTYIGIGNPLPITLSMREKK